MTTKKSPMGLLTEAIKSVNTQGAGLGLVTLCGYHDSKGGTQHVLVDTKTNYVSLVQQSLGMISAWEDTDLGEIATADDLEMVHLLQAKDTVTESLRTVLTEGPKPQPHYESLGEGVKKHTGTGEVYISGKVISRVETQGVHKETKHRDPTTAAAEAIRRRLPSSLWRQYKVSSAEAIVIGGQMFRTV